MLLCKSSIDNTANTLRVLFVRRTNVIFFSPEPTTTIRTVIIIIFYSWATLYYTTHELGVLMYTYLYIYTRYAWYYGKVGAARVLINCCVFIDYGRTRVRYCFFLFPITISPRSPFSDSAQVHFIVSYSSATVNKRFNRIFIRTTEPSNRPRRRLRTTAAVISSSFPSAIRNFLRPPTKHNEWSARAYRTRSFDAKNGIYRTHTSNCCSRSLENEILRGSHALFLQTHHTSAHPMLCG